MPGIPQLREYGWLHPPGSDIPIAGVRLEERMDGSGAWDVRVNDPASESTQRTNHPDEASARVHLGRIYEVGRLDGEWRIRQPDNPHDGPQVTDADR